MPLFSDEEKAILQQALSMYVQIIQQRYPQQEVEKVLETAQGILEKAMSPDEGGAAPAAKPRGISDEWFESCCKQCEKLDAGGKCLDKITEKFPGKCDPILKYERKKLLKN